MPMLGAILDDRRLLWARSRLSALPEIRDPLFRDRRGGASLNDVDRPPEGITQKVARTENFVLVCVEGKRARVKTRRPDGEQPELVGIAVK
jgi:hypothetical protein